MLPFKKDIVSIYGEIGKEWLAGLPSIIHHLSEVWNLESLKPLNTYSSYNYLLSGFQQKQPIILKLNPTAEAINQEYTALKAFAEYGVVEVLAKTERALLLQRAVAGNSLENYFPNHDDPAIQIVCRCLKKLHQAPILSNSQFPTIKKWLNVLDKACFSIPPEYLTKARKMKEQLLQTAKTSVLLHGDLHHNNIISNADDWLVIDPKGVIGEPAYEVAAFIRNPIAKSSLLSKKIIINRIKQFSSLLELDENRIASWCFVQAVLGWVWSLQDGMDSSHFIHLTNIFNEITLL